jgi:CRP-like cAMP-binding protein
MPTLDRTYVRRHFQRRTTLPDESDFFWKITAGVVRTITWTEEGDMIVLGIWGKGDIVGSSLSATRPYEIECLAETIVQPIPLSFHSIAIRSGIMKFNHLFCNSVARVPV